MYFEPLNFEQSLLKGLYVWLYSDINLLKLKIKIDTLL